MHSSLSPEGGSEARWCFIVGAPRCGTTAMAYYLRTHPDVCFAKAKEPHFFSRHDLGSLSLDQLTDRVEQEYLDAFFPHRRSAALMVEGSVSYLYAPERMEAVLKLWPNAQFIIAVRNPLEMLPSLHQRNLKNGDESAREFERAWALIPARRTGRRIPRRCADPRLLDYEEIGRLGTHVRNFVNAVGHERCFISIYDDFAADPGRQYRRVLDFLGLRDDGRTEFERHRSSVRIRSAWLQRLLKRPPKALLAALGPAVSADGKGPALHQSKLVAPGPIMRFRKALLQWNKAPEKPRMTPRLRAAICTALRDEIEELSEFLGRDLRHWLDPDAAGYRPHPPRTECASEAASSTQVPRRSRVA